MAKPRFVIENGILKGEERIVDIGDANLGGHILQRLRSKPDFVGQVDAITGEECDYGKMEDESIRCSLWFRKEGMKPGDIVCLFTHNHLASYIPCLATFYNRAVLCPSFSGHSLENLKFILELIKPKFVFADEREAFLIHQISREENLEIKIVVFDEIPGFQSLREILREQELNQVFNFICTKPKNAEDDCLLVFTSGSSGEPKPTLHSYKAVMETVMISLAVKKKGNLVTINYSPMGWICGIINTIIDLMNFVKKIIVHEKGHQPEEVLGFIEKYKVDIMIESKEDLSLVTSLTLGLRMIYRFYVFDKLQNYDTSSIKSLSLGGTKLKPEIMKFLKLMVPNGYLQLVYGSTELQMLSLISKANDDNLESCGFIFPNVQLKVVNPQTGKILGPNENGELCFKSPYMMKGYYKNPEATKKVFDEEGWYHSGDLGYFDENGNGYILGRIRSLPSISNETSLTHWEVERILFLNSDVVEVSSISIPEDSTNPSIFAFVTLIPASKVTEEELTEMLKCLMMKKVEITVKILDSMPLTYNGKVKIDILKRISESIKSTDH